MAQGPVQPGPSSHTHLHSPTKPNRTNKRPQRTDNSASRSRVSERNSEENDRGKNKHDLNDHEQKDPRCDAMQ